MHTLFYPHKPPTGHGTCPSAPRKLHQLGGEIMEQDITDLSYIPMPPAFAYIPWRHHVEILHKSNTVDEALYYARQTIINSWSRKELIAALRDDMFTHRKGALTNFATTLPAFGSQLTDELIQENFTFSYLTLKEQYSEQDLEDALETNITQFQQLPLAQQTDYILQASHQGAAMKKLSRITGISYRQINKIVKRKSKVS